ncbi:coth protein-domain-containing protein [Sporodiniella umbellata]|nr:coth protein-domain-containing protein [Sporodiniella umbellata]
MNQSVAVVVDNIAYKLNPDSTHSILHTGRAPVALKGYYYKKLSTQRYAEIKYKDYIKIEVAENVGVRESFERLPVKKNTLNEFFNRSWNIHNNYQLPKVYEPLKIIHELSSNIHKDDEIPTIHIEGNPNELDSIHRNAVNETEAKTSVSFIATNEAFKFEGAMIRISGQLTRNLDKSSYRLKLKKKDRLYGYRTFKLRAMATDKSYLREQLAYGVSVSAGLASPRASYVRLIINHQDVGLFGFVDHVKNPWLANKFDYGNETYENGPLYASKTIQRKETKLPNDLSYQSNLTLYTEGQYLIREKASNGSKTDFLPLQTLTKLIEQAPISGPNAANEWKSFLDTDSVLRSIALETLLGNGDGYVIRSSNYHIYQDPKSSKFIWIPFDMDLTLGTRIGNATQMLSGNYRAWRTFEQKPLTKKITDVPELRKEFEEIIQKLNEEIINPKYIFPRIDSIADMIREDVIWDKSCVRLGNPEKKPLPPFIKEFPDTPFDEAINGTVISEKFYSVKYWLQSAYQNTTNFYSQEASKSS